MALTNLAVFGGAFFTPILVGRITHVKTLGWPWTFYFVAIFTAVCLPLVYFFVPETAFVRPDHLNTDIAVDSVDKHEEYQKHPDHQAASELNGRPASTKRVSEGRDHASTQSATGMFSGAGTPKKTRSETLRIFNGRVSQDSFWKLALRPFPLFAHPAVFWASLIQGAMVGWTVFMGIILAAIFLGPPLYWNEQQTGYAYAGAFIGAVIGFLMAGLLADWSARFLTRRNNGVYEPEFRIILVIPQLIFGCAGLYLFGVTAAALVDYTYFLPIVGFGFQVGGMVIGAVAASLYIVDAHRDIAIEAFTTTILFKVSHSIPPTFILLTCSRICFLLD
jgi:MFS family permease